MKFEWDKNKNKANKIKHGVSFKEAEGVFYDEYAVVSFDEEHSEDEERFVIIGQDKILREMTVCHCYRGEDKEVIRIISARKATESESDIYNGRL